MLVVVVYVHGMIFYNRNVGYISTERVRVSQCDRDTVVSLFVLCMQEFCDMTIGSNDGVI